MTSIAVVDADMLAYRVAAANEKRTVAATHKVTAQYLEFDTATDFKAWAGVEAEEWDLVPKQTPGKIEHCFHSLNSMSENITAGAKCDGYHLVVSGDTNFRKDIPLPTRYKSNRQDMLRPIHLEDCKQYLIHKHKAEVSDGVEADDLLTGYAYQGWREKKRIVQCTLDKDALHGPGLVYDWVNMAEPELIQGYGGLTLTLREIGKLKPNGEPATEKIIKGKGRAFLWYQMVFGDPVDGYKPCELAKARFGEVGAYDLLKDAKNDKEALEAVVRKYRIWYEKPITYTAWDGQQYTKNWMEIMQMYADCCVMRRFPGDRLIVEDLLNRLGVKYA
jgi:hypothetical protein